MLVKAGLIAGLAGLAGGVVTSVELTRPVSYPVQSKVEALYLLNQAWYAMPPAFLQIQSEEQSCHALACLTAAFGRGAQIVQTFIVGVREAGIPPPYTAEAGRLIAAASRLAGGLSRAAAIRSNGSAADGAQPSRRRPTRIGARPISHRTRRDLDDTA